MARSSLSCVPSLAETQQRQHLRTQKQIADVFRIPCITDAIQMLLYCPERVGVWVLEVISAQMFISLFRYHYKVYMFFTC